MLSNLANYLLGYGDANGRQEEPREADTAPTQRLISETEDDDWVVVNQPGDDGEVEGATGMEESWFVTPPPCFASTGPVSVETSPLENLLIEHPSMSVYRRSSPGALRRTSPYRDENRRPLSSGSSTPTVRGNNTRPAGRVSVQPSTTVVSQDTPARPATRHHRHPLHHLVQQQQVQLLHHAQKVENRTKTDNIKKSHLERTNKVKEVVGRNKRQRRSDRQNKPSGANNNRKCC